MYNYFLVKFLIIIFASKNISQYCVSFSLQRQPVFEFDVSDVSKLVEATFNGYDCLNILIYNEKMKYYQSRIIKAIHSISNTVSVRLIESLENAIHYCGFLVISDNMEGFYDFIEVRYDDVIRLLYIDSAFSVDDDDILQLDTDEIRLHDMDLVLVKLNASKKVVKIFVKTRYENKTHLVHSDFSKPFFHPKNFVPRSVNYNKKIVRYMAFDCPLFSIIINELVGGIEPLIYKEIERKLNYTAIGSVPDDDKRWGLAFPNRTITGGILKHLYERNVDIGFCAFWVDFSKLWVGTFSTYWEFECLQFLIPKPKLLPPHWKNILKPLPRTVWILLLLGLIIASSICYILKYFEERNVTIRPRGASIVTESLTVIGILLLSKNPEKNHGQSANRHIFMWWSLFALLITTLYSSSLVSHLTYPQFEPMIETVDGLVEAGYYWGTEYPIMANRFMDMENPLHVAFMNSYKREENEKERISRLHDGNYSIFAKIVGHRHFMEAFPLAPVNDQIIRQLLECGIIQYWLDRMFEPRYPLTTFTRVYEYKTPPEEIELTPLRVENLQGAFWIFVIGNQIACIAFVGEIIISKRKQKTS